MEAALRSKDRSLAGPTAPARGLFLWNVEYYASPTRPGRGDYWTVAHGAAREGLRLPHGAGIGPVDD